MNTVKHLLLTAVAVAWAGTAAWGQTPAKVKYRFIEAADLGVLGHISQTQNPYHRVDTTVYKGWTAWQNNQVSRPDTASCTPAPPPTSSPTKAMTSTSRRTGSGSMPNRP